MPVPKLTENTITRILANELEKRGVKASPFINVKIPGVGRREVDIWCENARIYVIEAKFSNKEWPNAISKIYHDYLPDPSIEGGFAVLYPDELAKSISKETLLKLLGKLKFKVIPIFRPEDRRKGFRPFTGTLNEVADTLAKLILNPPKYLEPSIPDIIISLRDIANRITGALRHLAGSELEDLFGGKDVFKNILQYEEHKYPVDELRFAAAYILVNQLLFYHVLSKARSDLFPEIDPNLIKRPSDLSNLYFNKVLDFNYKAVLAYDVASRIPLKYTPLIRTMITAIKAIAPEKVRGDLLGTIFHDLVPFEIRKSVAAFYTNVLAAELLAWLAIDRHDAKVADFAVGSGGLLVAAYRRKRFLLEQERPFTAEDHRRFVEDELLGVDVMPFAAHIAACHLALQVPEYPTNKVKIAVWDSTELTPGVKIPPIAALKAVLRGQATLEAFLESEPKVKGVVSLDGKIPEEISLEKYDVIIMNPPFTRQERIPEEYKKILFDRFSDYKEYLHGQMGYYGYFVLLADRFLKNHGKLALVLPASILRVKSSEGIRKLLSNRYQIEYIITGKGRLNFSESTWKREILLIAKKLDKNETPKEDITLAFLSRLPNTHSEVQEFAQKLKNYKKTEQLVDQDINIITINKERFYRDYKNWFKYIATYNPEIFSLWRKFYLAAKRKLTKFETFLYEKNILLKEGVESRKGMKLQTVFILRDSSRATRKGDVWILKKVEKDFIVVTNRFIPNSELKIPRANVVEALRTVAGNKFLDLTNRTDFILLKDFPNSDEFFFEERSKYRKILPIWENYVKNRVGNLIILRRFIIPGPGTIHLCYYSSTPIAGPGMSWVASGLSVSDAKILCLWFNSSFNFAQILLNRVEDVWIDLHKYILKDFYVLDPQKLSLEEKNFLIALFDKLKDVAFPSLKHQFKLSFIYRREIDKAIMKILGFNDSEINKMLSELYAAINSELS
ncbi:MAG: N-6 DNA methylase, partial [Candidatus Aminicenantes bacterium]|nr:N-6 DNA methylase [Candidatus Aminicenantes bacterium]